MQKSTFKYLTFTIYRHVARGAVTTVIGLNLAWKVARAQLSQASNMQWSLLSLG